MDNNLDNLPPSQPQHISPLVIDLLGRTKPWIRFLSVLGYIGSAFMILGGLVIMVTGFASQSSFGAPPALLGGLYILLSLLYLFPSYKLGQFATSIGHLIQSRNEEDLHGALDAQRSFWKFLGVMTLVVLGIYVLIIIIAIVAAAFAFI